MLSQFTLYSHLFNFAKATLLTAIFEIFRISLLFFILNKKDWEIKTRYLLILYGFYFIIAFGCFVSSSSGLYLEELEKEIIAQKELKQELIIQAETLKFAYVKPVQVTLDEFKSNIAFNEVRLAHLDRPSYRKNRI